MRICAICILSIDISIPGFSFVNPSIGTATDEADYVVLLPDPHFGCISITSHFAAKRVYLSGKQSAILT